MANMTITQYFIQPSLLYLPALLLIDKKIDNSVCDTMFKYSKKKRWKNENESGRVVSNGCRLLCSKIEKNRYS